MTMGNGSIILKIDSLSKIYKSRHGEINALNKLSFKIKRGEVMGLLGPNGAGKTTAVKLIMGFMAPSNGEIVFQGQNLLMTDPRKQFGYLPENFRPNPNLTVREYITIQSRLAGCGKKKNIINSLLYAVGMDRFKNRRISDLSKGMGQRLGLAQAFAGDPDFLVMDEPTSGLDPIGRNQAINLLLEMKNSGKTIFFCSHNLSEVERLCDRIGILVEGRLKFIGSVADFLKKWSASDLDESFRKEVMCSPF